VYSVPEGRATYGHAIGIIMQHDGLIRLPGDVGNATTYSFPVTYQVVRDFPMDALKTDRLRDYAELFVAAARELEEAGCKAITAGCGFLALLQPVLAEAVNVPVFASALIQVPLVYAMLRRDQKVGIITASGEALTERHYNAVGWSSEQVPIRVIGVEEEPARRFNYRNLRRHVKEPEAIAEAEAGMVWLARELVERDPSIGAIVFECTNMPPFADAVQRAVNRPVFDIVTLVNMVYESVTRKPYRGYC
jgi:Asp/Glu/hydantoin racemase